MIRRLFDRAGGAHTVQLAGTELTLPPEGRFGSSDDVRSYVERVRRMPAITERFERAVMPVAVRSRRGDRAAHYEREGATIAVPDSADGRWALRETVVLHELAHHLDPLADPPHGPVYLATLVDLVDAVLGPEAALVYRVILGDFGLRLS